MAHNPENYTGSHIIDSAPSFMKIYLSIQDSLPRADSPTGLNPGMNNIMVVNIIIVNLQVMTILAY